MTRALVIALRRQPKTPPPNIQNLHPPKPAWRLAGVAAALRYRVTEGDLEVIWARLEKYHDASSGAVKVNTEELLTVMASFEIHNLAAKEDLADSAYGDRSSGGSGGGLGKRLDKPGGLDQIRSGRKRLSTFAAALTQSYAATAGLPSAGGGGGGGDGGGVPKLGSGAGTGAGAGRRGSTSTATKHTSSKGRGSVGTGKKFAGRTATHTDRPLFPAERAREAKNAMLRSKLRDGREAMAAATGASDRAAEALAARRALSGEERSRASAEALRLEERRRAAEEAERRRLEGAAREHDARVAERFAAVGARRERLNAEGGTLGSAAAHAARAHRRSQEEALMHL